MVAARRPGGGAATGPTERRHQAVARGRGSTVGPGIVSIPSMALVKSTNLLSIAARVKAAVGHHAMHSAALHAEVAGVIEWQHGSLAQVAFVLPLPVKRVDPNDLHALVDAVEQHLRAVDLHHSAEHLAVVVVLVEVVRPLPAEVARRLDLRRHIAEHVARVLVVNDRLRSARGVGLGELERILVAGACDGHRADAGDRPRPCEVAVRSCRR